MRRELAAVIGAVLLVGVLDRGTASASMPNPTTDVVVPAGSPVQIAVVLPDSTAVFNAGAGQADRNAINLAVAQLAWFWHLKVQVNYYPSNGCDPGGPLLDSNAAKAVVSNLQNVAVIGHICSGGFFAALSNWYQNYGVAAISGAATNSCRLPVAGPTVFASLAVPNTCPPSNPEPFDSWYPLVTAQPLDQLWFQKDYIPHFGPPTGPWADMYFDATLVILRGIALTAVRADDGSLTINRAALASTVRHTDEFFGVTCEIRMDPNTGFRVNDTSEFADCAFTFCHEDD